MIVLVLFPKRSEVIDWLSTRQLGDEETLYRSSFSIMLSAHSGVFAMSVDQPHWTDKIRGMRFDAVDHHRVGLNTEDLNLLMAHVR